MKRLMTLIVTFLALSSARAASHNAPATAEGVKASVNGIAEYTQEDAVALLLSSPAYKEQLKLIPPNKVKTLKSITSKLSNDGQLMSVTAQYLDEENKAYTCIGFYVSRRNGSIKGPFDTIAWRRCPIEVQ